MSLRAVLLCLLLGGCQEDSVQAATQVVVLVGGGEELRALSVQVFDEQGGELASKRTIELTRRVPSRLPTSFTIVPHPEGEAAGFRLVVQGLERDAAGATQLRARSELTARFRPQQTTLLPVWLSERCAEQRCGCQGDGPCVRVCAPESGQCVDVPSYPMLSVLEPGHELDALSEGLSGCPRGTWPAFDGQCRDLDECAFALDACSRDPRACVNLPPEQGRYSCACPQGFVGSGEADDPCLPS